MRFTSLAGLGLMVIAAVGAAAQNQVPVLPEKGHLWVVLGAEWSAVVVTGIRERDKGDLYLWHREQEWQDFRGYFEHIPLDGLACVDGMSWSPNGRDLAFYEEVDGQVRFCHVRAQEGVARRIARKGVSYRAWSPNSRYLAFVQKTEGEYRLRCFPKDTALAPVFDETWEAYEVFDLPALENRTIAGLQWAPDSSRLLAVACVRQPRQQGFKDKILHPALFLTWPGAEEPEIVWQDEQLEDHLPRAHWADGGKLIVFSLEHCTGGYTGVSGPLLGIRPNGTGLRVFWEEPEVKYFELSPDGQRVLLWLLPGGQWPDGAPEPKRMGAVNLIDGTTRLYEEDVVALEPLSRSGGVTQSIEWADDCSSVSLFVHGFPDVRDKRRITLDLP